MCYNVRAKQKRITIFWGTLCIYGGLFTYTFFTMNLEFSKNANSGIHCGGIGIPISFVFVWRQLGFAFFGALTFSWRTFYFSPRNIFTFKETQKCIVPNADVKIRTTHSFVLFAVISLHQYQIQHRIKRRNKHRNKCQILRHIKTNFISNPLMPHQKRKASY